MCKTNLVKLFTQVNLAPKKENKVRKSETSHFKAFLANFRGGVPRVQMDFFEFFLHKSSSTHRYFNGEYSGAPGAPVFTLFEKVVWSKFEFNLPTHYYTNTCAKLLHNILMSCTWSWLCSFSWPCPRRTGPAGGRWAGPTTSPTPPAGWCSPPTSPSRTPAPPPPSTRAG